MSTASNSTSSTRNKAHRPKLKAIRALRTPLWSTTKDTYARRSSRPGQHGAKPLSKSGHAIQLEAKQRIKLHYDVQEKQFKNAFGIAMNKMTNRSSNISGTKIKTEFFIQILESRLQTLIYRAGFATSIHAAKQMVSHKHFMVNGRKVNIRSYPVKPGDVVSCVDKDVSKNLVKKNFEIMSKKLKTPEYIELDDSNLSFTYKFQPESSQINFPFKPDLPSVKLYYSK